MGSNEGGNKSNGLRIKRRVRVPKKTFNIQFGTWCVLETRTFLDARIGVRLSPSLSLPAPNFPLLSPAELASALISRRSLIFPRRSVRESAADRPTDRPHAPSLLLSEI